VKYNVNKSNRGIWEVYEVLKDKSIRRIPQSPVNDPRLRDALQVMTKLADLVEEIVKKYPKKELKVFCYHKWTRGDRTPAWST